MRTTFSAMEHIDKIIFDGENVFCNVFCKMPAILLGLIQEQPAAIYTSVQIKQLTWWHQAMKITLNHI